MERGAILHTSRLKGVARPFKIQLNIHGVCDRPGIGLNELGILQRMKRIMSFPHPSGDGEEGGMECQFMS